MLGSTVVSAFVRAAHAHAARTAVREGQRALSYAQLRAHADAVARRLRHAGVGTDDVVACWFDRGLDAVVAILGVLQAGAAYLPVDPAYPAARTRFMLEDARPRALLYGARRPPPAEGPADRWLVDVDAPPDEGGARPAPAIDPADLAYVLYTSGSTGRPKGVAMPHAPLANLIQWQCARSSLGPGDRTAFYAPLSFDVHAQELFATWQSGGELVIVPDDARTDPLALLDLLRAENIARLHLPFVALQQLAEAAATTAAPASLREVITAGEQLQVTPAVTALFEALPGCVLDNHYGPTETHVVTAHRLTGPPAGWPALPPIGRPLPGVEVVRQRPDGSPAGPGEDGELVVGGVALARGYLHRDALTAERFVTDEAGARWYKTGDLVAVLDDGNLQWRGRLDGQVKVRGHRIELGEVEVALARLGGVRAAAAAVHVDHDGDKRLVGYVVGDDVPEAERRAQLAAALPAPLVPARIVSLDELPRTPSGKVDRRALPAPAGPAPRAPGAVAGPVGGLPGQVAAVFADVLGRPGVDVDESFFAAGGDSLKAMTLVTRLQRDLGRRVPVAWVFDAPTARGLAARLDAPGPAAPRRAKPRATGGPCAIVGIAARLPGARDKDQLWRNLVEGREATRFFSREELDPAVPPADRAAPDYVTARGILDDVDVFDAGYFQMLPHEAAVTDPQQRILLELAVHALEDAGLSRDGDRSVGVIAGVHNNSYRPWADQSPAAAQVGAFATMTANEKDYVATRVAYRLGLTGPALSVHTACSTSLVAVALAVEQLRDGRCDVVLAGGASVVVPSMSGHRYLEGGMLSRDGHCRPFDADATGTVFSDGAGVVALMRLEDALAEHRPIYAVVRGVGLNNDGGGKASFTAPSAAGQAACIQAALDDAQLSGKDIGYVEAHGTATPLGDPIELEGLRLGHGPRTGPACPVGAVKSNFGHTTAAAGVTGLIKAALALHHEYLPPTLHQHTPNPRLDLAAAGFRLLPVGEPWPRGDTPRRAGVSSFGVGGTNAHVVLEQAPAARPAPPATAPGPQVVVVTGDTEDAVARNARAWADVLDGAGPHPPVADVAFTAWTGRTHLRHRRAVVAPDRAGLVAGLRADGPVYAARGPAPVAFLFPGQGAQCVGMARGLYDTDPVFRAAFDEVAERAAPLTGTPLGAVVFADPGDEAAAARLTQTDVAQVALFAVGFGLARRLMRWGIEPAALLGHSIGEFVAATLSGVFSVEDGVRAVAERGRAMQAMPPGAMLSVRGPADEVMDRVGDVVELAADNAPRLCVVAGPAAAVDEAAARLAAAGVPAKRLVTSHAFHSAAMAPAAAAVGELVADMPLSPPRIPIVSTVTGTWLTDAQACDPGYWATQLRRPVRFAAAAETLDAVGGVWFECGPRRGLSTLCKQGNKGRVALPTLAQGAADDDGAALLGAVGEAFARGVPVEGRALFAGEPRRLVSLPGHVFAATRHWAGPPRGAVPVGEKNAQEAIMATETGAGDWTIPLRTMFEELSGLVIADEDVNVPFFELGIDSLLLTQAATELQKRFGAAVRFRDLMESVPTLAALAETLAAQAAPPVSPAPAAPVAPQPAPPAGLSSTGAAGDDGFVRAVIEQQLAIMKEQVALLQGRSAPATPPPPPDGASLASGAQVTYDAKTAFGAIARIHTDSDGLSAKQRQRLDALIERYVAKTKSSKAHTQQHRAVHADPRVVSGFKPLLKEITYPIVTQRAEGARLWDLDGNEYVDALNGFGSNFFGYSPGFVKDALHAQVDRGFEIGPQTEHAGIAAGLVCELTGLDRAAFCNTGSEAVMGAMRIARTVTGRSTIVVFSGAYHGIFDEVIVRDTNTMRSIPAAPGILREAVQNVLVLPYGEDRSLEVIAARGEELAAVLVEPVQSRRPDFQPRAFLHRLRELTAASGAALIFDEVITGFRAGPGGAQEHFGVRADLATYGKAPGGGMPIGLIAGQRRWMDALDGGMWQFGDDSRPEAGVTYFAGTFVRHPLTMAAVRVCLEKMLAEGPGLQRGMAELTAELQREINEHCEREGVPLEVRRFTSLFKPVYTEPVPHGELLFCILRDLGVHIWDGFPCFLSAAHGEAEVAFIVDAFKKAIREMQAGAFLPRAATGPAPAAGAAGFDPAKPPVPGARLGRDRRGNPAWFVPSDSEPGKYVPVKG